MSDQRPPVEVREDELGDFEITCRDTLTKLDDSNGQGRLYWKMPRQDARDLATWWQVEDLDVKNGRNLMRDKLGECGEAKSSAGRRITCG